MYTAPDKRTLCGTLGPPAQGAVAIADAKTLMIIADIVDPDLDQPARVHFPHY